MATDGARVGRPRKEGARIARTYKLPPDTIKRLEERCARLGMDRTAFVERALEAALGGSTTRSPDVGAETRASASPRAPAAASAPLRPSIRPDVLPNRADAFRGRNRG